MIETGARPAPASFSPERGESGAWEEKRAGGGRRARLALLPLSLVAALGASSCGGGGGSSTAPLRSQPGVSGGDPALEATPASPGDVAGEGGGLQTPPGAVRLGWRSPSTRVDGSRLENLAGFRVYDGPASGSYPAITDVGNVSRVTLLDLPSGLYYLTVTAYDGDGIESDFSEEVVAVVD